MREIYLDNSATTAVCPEASSKAIDMMTVMYGNPSSLHSKGLEAELEIKSARQVIATSIGASAEEIYFCSGGTEANNLAVFGSVKAYRRTGNKIVTTAFEHSSVLESIKELEKQGFEVTYITPDTDANLPAEKIINALSSDTVLASVMLVNNELGTQIDTPRIAKAIKLKKLKTILHCDAVQAYGKIPIKVSKLGAQLVSVSAHKVHGPKGVGALYVEKGTRLTPLIYGGEQQKKLRPGTEASPLIASFSEAVKQFDIEKNLQYINELNAYCREKLNGLDDVVINSPDNALPYILNLSIIGIRSETMLHHLALKNIFVSSGSACSKGKKSHVLTATGLSNERADSAIRVSFSKYNTFDDIDMLISALDNGIKTLARSR